MAARDSGRATSRPCSKPSSASRSAAATCEPPDGASTAKDVVPGRRTGVGIPQACVRNPGTRTGLGGGVLGSVIVESSPRPGYYPDPSVPGYIRYWDGSKWVPG